MKTSRWVLLALLAWGVAEIVVLSLVAQVVGVFPVVLFVIAEALLGFWLIRREGRRAGESLRQGQQDPAHQGASLTDSGVVVAGAVLLIVPGLISDAVGALFLIPATRPLARRATLAVFNGATRKYRDQADLLRAHLDRDSVVEGSVDDPARKKSGNEKNAGPDGADPTIIKGEIEP